MELTELQDENFDLSLTGFDETELAELSDEDADAKEDDFDVDGELQKPCFSKPGDLWKLGRHTVFCGDGHSRLRHGRNAGDSGLQHEPQLPSYPGDDEIHFWQGVWDAWNAMNSKKPKSERRSAHRGTERQVLKSLLLDSASFVIHVIPRSASSNC